MPRGSGGIGYTANDAEAAKAIALAPRHRQRRSRRSATCSRIKRTWSITAPADEYFGHTKLSPIGVRNALAAHQQVSRRRLGSADDAATRSTSSTHSTTGVSSIRATTSCRACCSTPTRRWTASTRPKPRDAEIRVKRLLTVEYNASAEAQSLLGRRAYMIAALRRSRRRSRATTPRALTLCSIGSHSALEVAAGARAARSAQSHHHRARPRANVRRALFPPASNPPRGCVDATLVLDKFSDMLAHDVQDGCSAQNVIFVANRSFEVYLRQRYTYARDRARDAGAVLRLAHAAARRRARRSRQSVRAARARRDPLSPPIRRRRATSTGW